MANELTISGSLAYADSEGAAQLLERCNFNATVATKKFNHFKIAAGTSEEAVPLGECTSPGWLILRNRDATNYVEVKTGTSGTIFAKILAGEICLLRLGSGAQAPFIIANTAACQVEGLVIQT